MLSVKNSTNSNNCRSTSACKSSISNSNSSSNNGGGNKGKLPASPARRKLYVYSGSADPGELPVYDAEWYLFLLNNLFDDYVDSDFLNSLWLATLNSILESEVLELDSKNSKSSIPSSSHGTNKASKNNNKASSSTSKSSESINSTSSESALPTSNIFETAFYAVCNSISSTVSSPPTADPMTTEDAVLTLTMDLLNIEPNSTHRQAVLNTLKRSNFDIEETVSLMEKIIIPSNSSSTTPLSLLSTGKSSISYAAVSKRSSATAPLAAATPHISDVSSVFNCINISADEFPSVASNNYSPKTSSTSLSSLPSFIAADGLSERNLERLTEIYRQRSLDSKIKMQQFFREAVALHSKKTGYLSTRCAEKGREQQYQMIVNGNKAAICTILNLNRAKNPEINIDLDEDGGFYCRRLSKLRCNNITLDLHYLFVREAIEFIESLLYSIQEGTIFSSDFAGKNVSNSDITIDFIVGLGSHSFNSESKLRPAIIKYLKHQNISATTKGHAIVTCQISNNRIK